jgi:hypothetical protein
LPHRVRRGDRLRRARIGPVHADVGTPADPGRDALAGRQEASIAIETASTQRSADHAGDALAHPAVAALRAGVDGFSLVLGGPLYQLLRRARLEERVEDHLLRRTLVISCVLWLPLLALCTVEGTAVGGVEIPFLLDVETHVRFLVVVPLFIVAELLVHRRLRGIVAQFVERGLVTNGGLDRFDAALRSAMSLRNSVAAELALVAVVYTLGYYIHGDVMAREASTWYARADGAGVAVTGAGLWLTWVSTPVMQFLLLRWYYRIFIWARFLWQTSRIELTLVPTHPDRNGGLGFLGGSAYAMSPLLMAHGAAVAGYAASLIFFEGASLADFKLEIVLLVAILLVVVLGPLAVFTPKILAAKRDGLRRYGVFAADYARGFERRWLAPGDPTSRDPTPRGEAALGAADIQSLADLDAAVQTIRSVTPLPVARDTILQLIVATVIPFAPLLFTLIPLEELLDRIIGAVF